MSQNLAKNVLNTKQVQQCRVFPLYKEKEWILQISFGKEKVAQGEITWGLLNT